MNFTWYLELRLNTLEEKEVRLAGELLPCHNIDDGHHILDMTIQ